jgi:hypothetical protein
MIGPMMLKIGKIFMKCREEVGNASLILLLSRCTRHQVISPNEFGYSTRATCLSLKGVGSPGFVRYYVHNSTVV